jgi:hydroxymethylpyrimidine kinase / phosphomethylpyrimidine kinase / thiamine-phosphate diphosphorylase
MKVAVSKPIVWSIAGNDSGGGAGLTADQRMADACGVHLCPVVSSITAQNSLGVHGVYPMPVEVLEAQLEALAQDMPPRVVKTGLLANSEQVYLVARWIDRLRMHSPHPVALVVDPVLRATTGTRFADAHTLAAYQTQLLPRTTLLTPNRREAACLLGDAREAATSAVPAQAALLRAHGIASVCITGGDSPDTSLATQSLALDWLDTPHAQGWLALPRIDATHQHGSGCSFAMAAAAALARGFVAADALVTAKMATTHALRHGYAAGLGSGPVQAHSSFCADASLMPWMSWGDSPHFPAQAALQRTSASVHGLYAIVDSSVQLDAVLAAGVRTVQLRIKTPDQASPAWHAALERSLRHAIQACSQAGASLFINDHLEAALACSAPGIHLGQEDLLALSDAQRQALADSPNIALGISSHSLWELARARSIAPSYIACGPVWPTTTKAMPWLPQGLDNLAWWSRMAGCPVVAIGGVLTAEQVHLATSHGASAVCVVRALSTNPHTTVPALQHALDSAPSPDAAQLPMLWPHPSLLAS